MKRLLIAVFIAALSGAARAQEVVAVLGVEQRPYRETFESFQAAFGAEVPVLPIGAPVPAGAKIVLVFGGKAALQRYPARVTLIYAIAPGVLVERKTHGGPMIKIMIEPEAGSLLEKMRSIQPGLKRLAVLWSSASRAASAERLVSEGAARGVAVSAERLEDAAGLPGRLRDLKGKVDAIWLPPDPLLINARNFEIIRTFSSGSRIPFYAPTEGLCEQGAAAAVSVTYEEMGRAMAAAAKAALGGASLPTEAYSARLRVCVNRAAATEAGLPVTAEALKTADKVLP